MSKQTCTQHGCPYDADEPVETCPVCNNPQGEASGEPAWEDHTKKELLEQCDEWQIVGYSTRNTKAELIELLEAYEVEATFEDGGD